MFFLSIFKPRDAPLYVEWAPANVLSQAPTTEGNEKSGVVVGEDAKRVILEQHLGETSEADADPDRVQVGHPSVPLNQLLFLLSSVPYPCFVRVVSPIVLKLSVSKSNIEKSFL